MKMIIFLCAMSLLAGCDLRNKPEVAAKDYAICIEAGMDAVSNSFGEIFCKPKKGANE